MACPFLDKLPSELRNRIYGYVFDFDNVPLRHVTQLQPFVKKLTGVDGELPFALKDPKSSWDAYELPFGDQPVATDILCTNKLIYTEAVKTFYEENIISVDVELFRLPIVTSSEPDNIPFGHRLLRITSPMTSDLSLARRLLVKFNKSSDPYQLASCNFNVVNLRHFLPRAQHIFPRVSNIVLRVDETHRPVTSLFHHADRCRNSPALQHMAFDKVGSFTATFQHGTRLTVEYKVLADRWEHLASFPDDEDIGIFWTLEPADPVLAAAWKYRVYKKNASSEHLAQELREFRRLGTYFCPYLAGCDVDSLEFWTEQAGLYTPFNL